MARRPRPSGRRRLSLERITYQEARSTTFCKRRLGIFKKASEISTLCGTQTTFLVFCEAGNAFSFGSPSFNTVFDNYQNQVIGHGLQVMPPIQAGNNNLDGIFEALNQARQEKEGETARENELKVRLQNANQWMGKPLKELNMEQLTELSGKIKDLKLNIE